MRKYSFILVVVLGGLAGCSKDSSSPCTQAVTTATLSAVDQIQLAKDIEAIDTYLAAQSPAIVATKDETGVRYVVTTQGSDARPCLESTLKVKYTGKLFNGTIFDASVAGASFKLNQLILGWQISFLKFGPGTKATLYVPSGYAYGTRANGNIPGNSNLIFEVELISIN